MDPGGIMSSPCIFVPILDGLVILLSGQFARLHALPDERPAPAGMFGGLVDGEPVFCGQAGKDDGLAR